MSKKIIKLYAKDVREWFAFYGGEELGISLEHASIVWDAATKAAAESSDYSAAIRVIEEYCKSDDHWTITKLQEYCRTHLSKKSCKSQTKKLQEEVKKLKDKQTKEATFEPWMTHFHD